MVNLKGLFAALNAVYVRYVDYVLIVAGVLVLCVGLTLWRGGVVYMFKLFSLSLLTELLLGELLFLLSFMVVICCVGLVLLCDGLKEVLFRSEVEG